MNKIDLEKLIPSKVVREQCIKENRTFNLLEQASLAWNNPVLTMHEKLDLLKIILKEGKSDPTWEDLCQQIEERIEFQTDLEKKYYSKEEGQYYEVSYQDKNRREHSEIRILFPAASKAQAYVFNNCLRDCRNSEYEVTKGRIGYEDRICAKFNGDREIMNIHSDASDLTEYQTNRFEEYSFIIPFPFRNGDFVKIMSLGVIGIFRGCRTEEEYQNLIQNDEVINGPKFLPIGCKMEHIDNFLFNTNMNTFRSYLPCLIELEYAELEENNPQSEVLKEAQALLKGEGSFMAFTRKLLIK